ncbi:MAG TPA: TIGR03560 family F420-dependent LLM class oxidoreductase [Euzebyales bacterium]|nr:TIGR03560 family F420-dependent LLM class oxidoreductase [Euzebyales bacterium]
MATEVRLPTRALIVLVGPSGAGKSDWAARHFDGGQIVSSDALRSLVGEGPHDQRAGNDAFALLDDVVNRRLRRGLLTVVDSLALDGTRRRGYVEAARRHGVPCYAVAFDVDAATCRQRNRRRDGPVPSSVLSGQLRAWPQVRDGLADEGFDGVLAPGDVALVPEALLAAPAAAARQRQEAMPMRFGLQISAFQWPDRPHGSAHRLAAIARAAEEAGFSSVWVMDHMIQVPQVGREWEDMLDSYTTLGYLAAVTRTCRLGVLVTAVTFRNVSHLAKIVATLDVLSGGRAVCGLGAAWFAREHAAYGWTLPPVRERFALLEEALQLLPLMWGPGAPTFDGELLGRREAICYPRPLQEHVPILVGGGGEHRTLRLVAQHADACNLMGEPDVVRRKAAVLAGHCRDLGRDPSEVEVTHLSPVLVGRGRSEVVELVDAIRGRSATRAAATERLTAGTVEEHTGRFRQLAEAGVQTAIVSLADLEDAVAIERFAPVIAAFEPDL